MAQVAQVAFDPSKPFTVDAVDADPGGVEFDPGKPFTVQSAAPEEETSFLGAIGKGLASTPAVLERAAGGALRLIGENSPASGAPYVPNMGEAYGMSPQQQQERQKAVAASADLPGSLAHAGKTMFESASADIQANAPHVPAGGYKDFAYRISQGVPELLAAIGLTAVSGNLVPAAAVIGGQAYAEKYGEAREEKRAPDQASMDAGFSGLVNGTMAMLPLHVVMKSGGTFLAKSLQTAGAATFQNAATEAMQIGYDKGIVGKDMPLGEAVKRITDAGIVGLVTGALLGAGMHGVEHATGGTAAPQTEEHTPPLETRTPEEAAAPVLEAGSVDDAIDAAKTVAGTEAINIDSAAFEAEIAGGQSEPAPQGEPAQAAPAAPVLDSEGAAAETSEEAPAEPAQDMRDIARELAPEAFGQHDDLAARHDTYTRWVNELRDARDNDPRIAAAQAQIDDILGKVNGVESRLTKTRAAQVADLRGGIQDFLAADTPDMARVKGDLGENYQKMQAVRPQVDAAMREAQARAAPVEQPAPAAEPQPVAAPPEATAPEPVTTQPLRAEPPPARYAPLPTEPAGPAAEMSEPARVEATSRFAELAPREARIQAGRYALENLRGSYRNEDTGWDIQLTGSGISKSLAGNGSKVRAEIVANLPDLLKVAHLRETHPDAANPERPAVHRFGVDMMLDGRLNRLKLTVREDVSGTKRHYAVDHVEIEPSGIVAPSRQNLPGRNGSEGNIPPGSEAFNKPENEANSNGLEPAAPAAAGEILEPRPRALSMKAIEGTGDTRQRAINNETYAVGEEAPQKEIASRLVEKNYDQAVAIALRQKQPPAGVHPEFVFMAVEAKATRDGDAALIERLKHSRIAEEATIMGQRNAAWRHRDPLSAVAQVDAVGNARVKALEAGGQSAAKAVAREAQQIEQQVKASRKTVAATRPRASWDQFIESITCAGE